ncbi:hypothetical protein AAVH_32021 [Aphelenchoides avenae]|nr:hypothetical protein AAVH_32021 [Aphelenchus avenae]
MSVDKALPDVVPAGTEDAELERHAAEIDGMIADEAMDISTRSDTVLGENDRERGQADQGQGEVLPGGNQHVNGTGQPEMDANEEIITASPALRAETPEKT